MGSVPITNLLKPLTYNDLQINLDTNMKVEICNFPHMVKPVVYSAIYIFFVNATDSKVQQFSAYALFSCVKLTTVLALCSAASITVKRV